MVRWYNDAIERPKPTNAKVIPALPHNVVVKRKPIRLIHKMLKGPSGRLIIIGELITKLIKYERITLMHHRAMEVQGYTERLITEAMRNGDRHIPTMELADFYIHEKQLIHKLFKVLVPRYMEYTESFTKLWLLSDTRNRDNVMKGKIHFEDRGCLELKGNPLPPIEPPRYTSRKSYLTNVLLDAAKKDFYSSKQFHSKKESNQENTS